MQKNHLNKIYMESFGCLPACEGLLVTSFSKNENTLEAENVMKKLREAFRMTPLFKYKMKMNQLISIVKIKS